MTNQQELNLHECEGIIKHNTTPYNVVIEVQFGMPNEYGGDLMVHDMFTKATPKPIEVNDWNKCQTCFSIPIPFCPFCKEQLIK